MKGKMKNNENVFGYDRIYIVLILFLIICLPINSAYAQSKTVTYKPTVSSLKKHKLPAWYNNAKLGIFIHWGLYSVPAWAPVRGQMGKLPRNEFFKYNPYAEWYLNSMRIKGSPTQKHEYETYGKNFNYYDFAKTFDKEIQKWNPKKMADLFKSVHARYVVLTTKHHDGFTLWPSSTLNPYLPHGERHASRDLVGELAKAVRADGMRMGLYYSGGFDWSFKPVVIHNSTTFKEATPQTQQYANYADAQWEELIHRYKPAILWNDITYPKKGDALKIFADFYNTVPDGVIDNRWNRPVYDFTTPEYAKYNKITKKKWEATRGIAYSFGYNQNSGPKQLLTVNHLVDMFVDIVSKNGNLLLDVGPKADGTIPKLQVERLKGLGNWLGINGEAIFGTRPWVEAEGKTDGGDRIRFTYKNGAVYAILLDTPKSSEVKIKSLMAQKGTQMRLFEKGGSIKLKWNQHGDDIWIHLPHNLPDSPAYTIKMDPQPSALIKKKK